jgi:hypothetical protein
MDNFDFMTLQHPLEWILVAYNHKPLDSKAGNWAADEFTRAAGNRLERIARPRRIQLRTTPLQDIRGPVPVALHFLNVDSIVFHLPAHAGRSGHAVRANRTFFAENRHAHGRSG